MKIKQKNRSNATMAGINICLTSILFILFSCNYGEGIKKETQIKFENNKGFITKLAFDGVLVKKEYCQECNYNKYVLKIHINSIDPKPDIGNIQYQPYYSFENDTILNLSVAGDLFKKLKMFDKISKGSNSHTLLINDEKVDFLSDEKFKWLNIK